MALLGLLRSQPPKTQAESENMRLRCLEQAWFHRRVEDAWVKVTSAQEDDSVPPEARAKLAALDFTPILAGKPEKERTIEETDELATQLHTLAEEARKAESQLPELLIEGEDYGNHEDQEDTLQVTYNSIQASQIEQPPAPDIIGTSARKTLRGIFLTDIVVTAIVAIGSVVFYVAPLYSSTWGSLTDLLEAGAAGFGTQLIVQWGALPLLQSRFGKQSPPDAAPPAVAAAPPTGGGN